MLKTINALDCVYSTFKAFCNLEEFYDDGHS